MRSTFMTGASWGAVHVRTPKNFVLEERLERYADAIETNPEAYAGDWREACAPAVDKPFEHLHLDLGCGKGTYLVERAVHEPNTLFIGMDQSPSASPMPLKICEQELTNALVLPPRRRIAAAAVCRRRARCHHR